MRVKYLLLVILEIGIPRKVTFLNFLGKGGLKTLG